MEVDVLGAVRVRVDGVDQPTGPPQQQALLAALALRRGRVVPARELAQDVWGAEAPPSASAIVRNYVHHLRRMLGTDAVLPVKTGTSHRGYRIGPAVLDLDRFEACVENSRTAEECGDLDEAAALLQAALALWRGTPLAGVPGPEAERRRTALTERHLITVTHRIELDVRRGRHRDVQPELQALVEAHPLDESLRALHMTVLYRCGRQADAIDAFQRYRGLVDEELGIDPGPALRALYAQIVQADPSLLPPRRGPERSRPIQLPAAVAGFIGRADVLARADALLADPGLLVLILAGMGGVGKTTTALQWAHHITDRYPDGQLYADLRGHRPGARTSADVLGEFLQALGVRAADLPGPAAAREALFRTLMADRRMILLLDNAADTDQVSGLLPGNPHCVVIVTSRSTLSALQVGTGARLLLLEPPEHEEALDMFAARVGDHRVRAERAASREIVDRSGRLPLAMALVAARAATRPAVPLAALAAELREADATLDGFRAAESAADVPTVLSWSYRALDAPAAAAFRLLSLHPGPDLTVPAAAAMIGLPITRAKAVLTELTAAALLSEHRPGRYATHDLVRALGRHLADEHESRETQDDAVRRLLDHYLHMSYAAAKRMFPATTRIIPDPAPYGVPLPGTGPSAWFDDEHLVLLAVLEPADRRGFERHAWQLACLVRDYLNRHGLWHHLQASQSIAMAAAVRLGDSLAEAHCHGGLALVETNMGRYPAAYEHLERALALFAAAGDHLAVATTHHRMAWTLAQQERHAEALVQAQAALALLPADPERRATVLNTISWLSAKMGRFADAVEHAHQALALADDMGPFGLADVWDTLGFAQSLADDHGGAEASYRRAIEIYRRHGAEFRAGDSWRSLGDARRAARDPAGADQAYREAIAIATTSDDPRAAGLLETCLRRLPLLDAVPPPDTEGLADAQMRTAYRPRPGEPAHGLAVNGDDPKSFPGRVALEGAPGL
ncbi:AfsR/SARP family transcriptional regulator [Paractinoplanes brasiliensis]|uniref:DNA-binding SARP family transcriptional activator n=1 Tax=Paractinoplanes brasiliensis TaxID=52695 RepID=A0A4R6JLJ8_9ACTN|nr:BTAD domain-containing putative transcriptional regulator [Actinoplanes brasiliensis]TDO37009.1 DNA-binding SARP family transcriptional activator [Actinoplanes brasiliensis]GID30532.1 SARP family transcriptional regulator [Actinoplanes brasiliensis]